MPSHQSPAIRQCLLRENGRLQPTPSNRLLQGYLLGLVGVSIFALTLPFTRIAVQEMSPLVLSLGRTVAAAAVAGP